MSTFALDAEAALSLESFLQPEALARLMRPETAADLASGRLVVIEEAFPASFAERMFQCLDQFPDWKLFQYSAPAEECAAKGVRPFRYHHHNIYDDASFPVPLQVCRALFRSAGTIGLVEKLSGQTCRAATSFSASWYRAGDYSTLHTDNVDQRVVSFVWHLTKDWSPDFGGALYWSATDQHWQPSFNSLYLFLVTPESLHCVLPVSAAATSKRLTINGWWRREKA